MNTITEADILYFKRMCSRKHRRMVLWLFALAEVLTISGLVYYILVWKSLPSSVNMGFGTALGHDLHFGSSVSGATLMASACAQGGMFLFIFAAVLLPLLLYGSRSNSSFCASVLDNMDTRSLPDKYVKSIKVMTRRSAVWAMYLGWVTPVLILIAGLLNLKLALFVGTFSGMTLRGVMYAWINGVKVGHNYSTDSVIAMQRLQLALTLFVVAIILTFQTFYIIKKLHRYRRLAGHFIGPEAAGTGKV